MARNNRRGDSGTMEWLRGTLDQMEEKEGAHKEIWSAGGWCEKSTNIQEKSTATVGTFSRLYAVLCFGLIFAGNTIRATVRPRLRRQRVVT